MIDGIYTAYMTGKTGQGMAMFVFRDGSIAGADMAGLTFSGKYTKENDRVKGHVEYRMPANSVSITGAAFEKPSDVISVPIDLPDQIDPNEVYQINTPIGPLNARFMQNVRFDEEHE